ncbi:hypothetical protein [Sorangium sp. So ce1151]|uniref:hypothetical protein n=1 Tax=Sorangium sp. So ce1151 TaxID=3133332 RepID=UPI003F5DD284
MTDAGARRQAFAEAFAAQGRSDWDVYKHLSALTRPSFPQCHTLHYLQILIPCTFDFPNLTMLRRPGGRSVMNLVERAFNDFERLRIQ